MWAWTQFVYTNGVVTFFAAMMLVYTVCPYIDPESMKYNPRKFFYIALFGCAVLALIVMYLTSSSPVSN